jgi:hypothetical protein
MALENLVGDDKFITALVDTNPTGGDDKREGDDHIRGIKNVLLNSFPNINGQVTATAAELDQLTDNTFDAAVTVPGLVTVNNAPTAKLTLSANEPLAATGKAFVNFEGSAYPSQAYVGFGGTPNQLDLYNEVGPTVLWGGAIEGVRLTGNGDTQILNLRVPDAGGAYQYSPVYRSQRPRWDMANGDVTRAQGIDSLSIQPAGNDFNFNSGYGYQSGDLYFIFNGDTEGRRIYHSGDITMYVEGSTTAYAYAVIQPKTFAWVWFSGPTSCWVWGNGITPGG